MNRKCEPVLNARKTDLTYRDRNKVLNNSNNGLVIHCLNNTQVSDLTCVFAVCIVLPHSFLANIVVSLNNSREMIF
jgi:hypothetical protein